MKIIIVGAGEVGFHIARRLSVENKDVVVIDKDPDSLRRVSDSSDVQVITGSGSSPLILEEAGIRQAEILLAVTNSDEINLIACLVANVLSPATKKLARVRDADFDAYHETFRTNAPHIDTIINPETEVVRTIDRLMGVPGAVDVEEFADGRVKFIGIYLDRKSLLDGVRLSEISARIGQTAPLIAAIIRNGVVTIPRGEDSLMAGDLIYFITEAEKLTDTLAVFNKQIEPVRRVMIVGGGRLGLRLSALLEKKNIYTKLIEKNPSRCLELAKKLNRVVVLQGDGSNQELLNEESIRDMDLVVTLTNDEKTNILASLLAKRMGARKTIARITSFSYFDLMAAIGIDQVVSPRLSAINTILRHIRRGKVLSAVALKGEQAEILEAVALETADIVGRPLNKISFPKGALVIVILRAEQVIIPSGKDVIEPGDRIIIFASQQAIPKIEKIMAVKLEYF